MQVAIAGGSVGGLFAAALLAKDGHDVTVYERSASGLSGRGAGLVAQDDVFKLLRLLGRSDVGVTGVTARSRITLDRSGAIAHRDPHPQTQISWDALYEAVRSQVPDTHYRLDQAVTSAGTTRGLAWLELSDGECVEADLVIGADGIGSRVRQSMFQASVVQPRYAGYVAWRFLLPEDRLPEIAAATLSEQFAFYHMEGGQALGYLVPGPFGETAPGRRRYNCVWYRRVDDLAACLTDKTGRTHPFSLPRGAVSDARREQLVEEAKALLPPAFAAVVAAEREPFVQAVFDLETPQMVDGRILLLGDAAFVARPHTAMGVAKAAGDAMALQALLDRTPIEHALPCYERERLRVGHSLIDFGRRLGSSLAPAVMRASVSAR